MYKLTEKENLMKVLNGEVPEYVPFYDFWGWGAGLPMYNKKSPNGYVMDEFGIEYTTTDQSMGGMMPVPGKVLLDDITKWHDVVKVPDLSGTDWEAVAKEALKGKDINTKPVITHNSGYFMTLMNMMGFVDGLCAMIEEPEEVYALFEYLNGYYIEREKALLQYFHPDVYELGDDTAANDYPFIDPEVYRALIKPFAKKEADLALDAGLKIGMHCCGKCECFIEDWLDMGVCVWEPAQVSNDLLAIKKKYQGRLTIAGGWDNQGPISYRETPDEELRQGLMDYVDAFAPNGGFCYMATVVGTSGEEIFDRKMQVIKDVYNDYAKDWYKNH